MVTHVPSYHGLDPTAYPGPLALDHHPTKITKGSTWASVEIVKQGLVYELVNAKLIV
jgi:hypothetical protein